MGLKGNLVKTPLLIANVSEIFPFMPMLIVAPLKKRFCYVNKFSWDPYHECTLEKEPPF